MCPIWIHVSSIDSQPLEGDAQDIIRLPLFFYFFFQNLAFQTILNLLLLWADWMEVKYLQDFL